MVWCIERLHRLPQEVPVSLSELTRAMIAMDVIDEKRAERREARKAGAEEWQPSGTF